MMVDRDLSDTMAGYAPKPAQERKPDTYCARCGVGPFYWVPERLTPELCIECDPTPDRSDECRLGNHDGTNGTPGCSLSGCGCPCHQQ